MIPLVFWTALLVLAVVYIFYWVYAIYKGAPFYPSSRKVVKAIADEALQAGSGLKIAELGAGDGRVAFALAKQGFRVDAFEINPFLSLIMRFRKTIGRYKTLNIYRDDFLKHDFSQYDILITYLYPGIMNKISAKLDHEARDGAILISNTFKFTDRKPHKQTLNGRLIIYKLGKSA